MPWLMKAEPDSRIVKGKDVKFSVDDFEKIGTSQWDGVRNHEAKSIMKDKMKLGDKVLFYHSNTKVPGVFALAEVAREGYPDYTAWDESHPYFDPKTDQAKPTWFMVDVKFKSRLAHPPTLALIRYLAGSTALPAEVEYIGSEGYNELKNMALVKKGRLSVQPVTEAAYRAIVELGTRGGWDELVQPVKKPKKGIEKAKTEETDEPAKPAKKEKKKPEVKFETEEREAKVEPTPPKPKGQRKSVAATSDTTGAKEAIKEETANGERRSKRLKR